jgi:hypothetical protein
MKNKSIFITAWNRDALLKKALYSLTLAKNYDEYKKVIIFQECNSDQENMVKKIDPKIVVIRKFYPIHMHVYHKLFLNLLSGFEKQISVILFFDASSNTRTSADLKP